MKKINIDKRDITFFLSGAAVVLLIASLHKWFSAKSDSQEKKNHFEKYS